MSSYLRPRRGKNATAVSQLGSNAPLKRGEVFFEVPDTGVGTGAGKIKMGDGSTAYANLPYFLEQFDLDNAKVAFTDSNTPDANPYTTNTTLATAIAPTASMKTIFTNLKQLLVNHNSQLTQLNNEIGFENITSSYTQLIAHTNFYAVRAGKALTLTGRIAGDVKIANTTPILQFPSSLKPNAFYNSTYTFVGTFIHNNTTYSLALGISSTQFYVANDNALPMGYIWYQVTYFL